MSGMPSDAHSRPTPASVRIMPGSPSPPRAVNRTTASAPRRAASSTSATCTTAGPRPPGRIVDLPEVQQQVPGAGAEQPGDGAVRPRGTEARYPVMDDDPEVALEHFVDRPLHHLAGDIRAVTDDPAGHDVTGEHNGP